MVVSPNRWQLKDRDHPCSPPVLFSVLLPPRILQGDRTSVSLISSVGSQELQDSFSSSQSQSFLLVLTTSACLPSAFLRTLFGPRLLHVLQCYQDLPGALSLLVFCALPHPLLQEPAVGSYSDHILI